MPSRAIFTVVAVAFVLVSSSVVAAVVVGQPDGESAVAADQAAPDGTVAAANGTVHVTASAERTAAPDAATIRLAVTAQADSADAAREQVAANASRMREALDEAGVDAEDLRTSYYDIGAVYDRSGNESRVVGYRAVHGFAADVAADEDELGERAGAVVDAAVGNGADRVESVTFTLHEETRADLRQRALRGAMENADRDAATLARAGDRAIAEVHSISTADTDVQPVDASFRAEDAPGGTTLDPAPITVSATVSVTYRLA